MKIVIRLFSIILIGFFLQSSFPLALPSISFLAPQSFYGLDAFANLLGKYIVDLEKNRGDEEAFSAIRNMFLKNAVGYSNYKLDFNTLQKVKGEKGQDIYEISFLYNDEQGNVFTYLYRYDKKGQFIGFVKKEDKLLYRLKSIEKTLDVLSSKQKDYSLDEYIFVTDPHGAYYKMIMLLAERLGIEYEGDNIQNMAPVLENEIIRRVKESHRKIIVNGDIPDRAPYPLKTFRLVMRLIKEGVGEKFEIGNHDALMAVSCNGVHCPTDEGFKGIPAGIKAEVNVDSLQANYPGDIAFDEARKLYEVDLNEYLKFKQQTEPNCRSKVWWANKYREFMQKTDQHQKNVWDEFKAKAETLFTDTYGEFDLKRFMNNEDVDPAIRRWWGDVLGFGFDAQVAVYTGMRAVERMPLSWWKDKQSQFINLFGEQHRDLQNIIDQVVIGVEREVFKYAEQDDWAAIIISQGVNQGLYKSIEWYSADWIFHGAEKSEADLDKGSAWGPSAVFERIKDVLDFHGVDMPWEKGEFDYFKTYQVWSKREQTYIELPNCVNYLKDEIFVGIGKFLKDNFTIYSKDLYENTYMHGFLPIIEYTDKKGDIAYKAGFTYQNVLYAGDTFFAGLNKLQSDIKNKSLSEAQEALTVFYSWFADETTKMKPKYLKKYMEYGLEKILDPIGVNLLFMGHNPLANLGKEGIGINMQNRVYVCDNDMSPYYRGMGLIMSIGANIGIKVLGYTREGSQIELNPVIRDKDGKEFKGANYSGMSRPDFLVTTIGHLEKELAKLYKLFYLQDISSLSDLTSDLTDEQIQAAA